MSPDFRYSHSVGEGKTRQVKGATVLTPSTRRQRYNAWHRSKSESVDYAAHQRCFRNLQTLYANLADKHKTELSTEGKHKMKRVPIHRNFDARSPVLGWVEYDETQLTDMELADVDYRCYLDRFTI